MPKKNTTISVMPEVSWQTINFNSLKLLPQVGDKSTYRFFKLTEISEDKSSGYRSAMANVISTLKIANTSLVYVLAGTLEGIKLYVGVSSSHINSDIPEKAKAIKASFEGNFLGIQLKNMTAEDSELENLFSTSRHLGIITGVPSVNESSKSEDDQFQGIERIANSLIGEQWQLTVVAQSCDESQVEESLNNLYALSTTLSQHIKFSVQNSENQGWQLSNTTGDSDSQSEGSSVGRSSGKDLGSSHSNGSSTSSSSSGSSSSNSFNEGSNKSKTTGSTYNETHTENKSSTTTKSGGDSLSLTRERTDKRIEELQKHINDVLLPKHKIGRSKGMYQTAFYVSAQNNATYQRLSDSVLSVFQGSSATMTPLQSNKIIKNKPISLQDIITIKQFSAPENIKSTALIKSLPLSECEQRLYGSTILNSNELSLIMGLPNKELPGLKIRKSVDFGLNTSHKDSEKSLTLGKIIQHGRALPNGVNFPINDLTKHIFITGVTGSGKTTTCMKLLLESELPFLVIEPAKTEYRALFQQNKNIEYYCIGNEKLTPFRLNPFELTSPESSLSGHIQILTATLAATYPMEAAMPQILEEAILAAYKNKGWDIHTNENYLFDSPWETGSEAWPTFSEMLNEIQGIIKSKGLGTDFEQKYQGSLVARLTNLTKGLKGRMLDTRHSIDFNSLLDKRVIIELEELKDEQDKSLFMGLIISRLAECMKIRHQTDKDFRHLTLIEEAHRLLSKPESDDSDSKKYGVRMFTDLLAEVRKYGEGLIIADQSPTKLVADVIKNTNCKIVHRLLDASDRNVIGDSMSLEDDQKQFLQNLQPGETIIYSGGWHAPVRVQIDQHTDTQGDVITVETIKKQGQKQLWRQASNLYPRLMNANIFTNEQSFSTFLKQGSSLVNLFLDLNKNIGDAKFNMKKRDAYQTRYLLCEQELQITEIELAQALRLLLCDSAATDMGIKNNEDEELDEVFIFWSQYKGDNKSAESEIGKQNRTLKALLASDDFKQIESI